MKRCYYLVLALLLLVITPVVAAEDSGVNETVIYDKTFTWSDSDVFYSYFDCSGRYLCAGQSQIYMTELLRSMEPSQLMCQSPASHLQISGSNPSGGWPVTFTSGGVVIGSGEFYYFRYLVGSTEYTQSVVDFLDVDWSAVVSGKIVMSAAPEGYAYPKYANSGSAHMTAPVGLTSDPTTSGYAACFWDGSHGHVDSNLKFYTAVSSDGTNRVRITDTGGSENHITRLELMRNTIPTSLYITDAHNLTYESVDDVDDVFFMFLQDRYPLELLLKTPVNRQFTSTILFSSDDPGEGDPGEGDPGEGDPGESPTVLRTGAVTMTDHNGTSISGFEVTAVNHYTGESYTVATDTDVAVITLPMERTTQIRNPQTGVYEEVPVGYYRFFGQSSGYKMLNEDGIQVAVMPEKYSSYKLCDIGVMSDSGPLTGKHKFQIRSRSDNSILQTGTISAKSATTGEWYNTTVSGGIATLILPYDTSNPKLQYAGNYYVYATSPGYEDSDSGIRIVVMPHTVSEIHSIQLTPIGGVPTPGNVTLRIQAISETGPGVVNAEIFIAGVLGAGRDVWDTYTASSTGYLTVSVPGNSTYDIVARGAGYYDSARRIEVFTEDPPLIEIKLYLSGAPTVEPTTQPTGWPTDHPTTQPTGGIPDEDDDSDGFLVQAVRGIGLAFGVGFATAKLIFGMLLALAIGFATAKQLRGGAAEFGVGLLGGTLLGVLIGLLPVWIIVVLLLVVGLYIGNRYVGGANNG